jgi:hypothetical protein
MLGALMHSGASQPAHLGKKISSSVIMESTYLPSTPELVERVIVQCFPIKMPLMVSGRIERFSPGS